MNISTAVRSLPVLLVALVGATPYLAADPQAADSRGSAPDSSEMRLSAPLIQDFLRVIYFGQEGRVHFREYSECNYEFVQNPGVVVQDGLVHVTAEYYRRIARAAGGACIGGPGSSDKVTLTARPYAEGTAVAIEITDIRMERAPSLTPMLLNLVGIELPIIHTFDLMGAMNRVLREQSTFGIASLEVHDVVPEDGAVLVRLTMLLGIW